MKIQTKTTPVFAEFTDAVVFFLHAEQKPAKENEGSLADVLHRGRQTLIRRGVVEAVVGRIGVLLRFHRVDRAGPQFEQHLLRPLLVRFHLAVRRETQLADE